MGPREAVLGLVNQTSSAWSIYHSGTMMDCGLRHTLQFGPTLWSNTTGPSIPRSPHTWLNFLLNLPLRFRLQRKEISRPFLTTRAPAVPSQISSHQLVGLSQTLLLLLSHWIVFSSLRSRELPRARLPCPSLSPWVCSNSCPIAFNNNNKKNYIFLHFCQLNTAVFGKWEPPITSS